MTLILRCLGHPTLADASGEGLFVRKKDLALLVYLVVERGMHRRSVLAGLLWGDVPEHNARHSLTQTISRLRELAGGESIDLVDGSVRWVGEIDCDVLRLERGEFEPDDYRGDFLAGFDLGAGSQAFEEWADRKRAEYRQAAVKLLDRKGAELEARQAWGEALQISLRLVQIEGTSEAGHRRVMRAWAALGERSLAAKHYERFRTWLETEVGVQPDPATTELAEEIRSVTREHNNGRGQAASAVQPPIAFESVAGVGSANADQNDRTTRRHSLQPGAGTARAIIVRFVGALALTALVILSWEAGRRLAADTSSEARVLFQSDRTGKPELYSMSITGSDVRRAGDLRKLKRFDPLSTPDGRYFAFESESANQKRDIFVIGPDDTVNVSRHEAEDRFHSWAPDGSKLLFVSFRNGNADLFAVDRDGSNLKQLTEDSADDDRGVWSPRGDLIAFRSVRDGRRGTWLMDADGHNQRPILPEAGTNCRFSPRGVRVACTGNFPQWAIHVYDLSSRHVWKLENMVLALWSPDGDWLLGQNNSDGNSEIYRLRFDGAVIDNISRDTANDAPIAWLPAHRTTYVDKVEILASIARPLQVGERRRLRARAFDAEGQYMPDRPLRWESSDTNVVRVESAGEVRSLRAGQAMIVVSAGGWRADSLAITVDARSARTVFHDDFESERLDTKWQVFGSPRPYVAARIGVSNSRGFVSNGDDYLESGVVSRASFSPWNGLTIELSARSPDKWKTHHLLGVMLGSIKLDSVTIATGGIFTPEFKTVATLQMVGGLQGMGPEVRLGYTVLSGWPLDGKWHRIALQVRPDGYQELYIDGRFWGESTPDPNGLTPARLVLGFRSHGTMLVHDSVTVYEGLKYFH